MGMGDAKSGQRNVAVFLDLENLVGGNSSARTELRLGALVTGIENLVRKSGVGSRTAVVRAYAHWGSPVMARFQREVLAFGVEPVQIFSFDKNVKNAADIELCVDVLALAHESPWIDVFVIATGDGGFVPLVRRLHALNKYAIVVSTNVPESGVVNSLLKSVADEYHQIPMSPVIATDPMPLVCTPAVLLASPAKVVPNVAATTEPKQPKQETKAKKTPKKPVADPSKGEVVAEIRRAIMGILQLNPELVVSHRVNVALLGQHLRSQYPELNYKVHGGKTLSDFLRKYCALGVRGTDTEPASIRTPVSSMPLKELTRAICDQSATPVPDFVVEAVRQEFTDGKLGQEVMANGAKGLKISLVGSKLRTAITGYPPPNAGFPLLHQVLEYALVDTQYRLVLSEVRSTVVVHSSFA